MGATVEVNWQTYNHNRDGGKLVATDMQDGIVFFSAAGGGMGSGCVRVAFLITHWTE